MAFDYATVNVGDAVEVSTEYPFQKPVSGKIVTADGMSCHIQIDGSPFPPLEFCRHVDDDWLGDGPDKFNGQKRLLSGDDSVDQRKTGPRTGIFRLAENQKRLNTLPAMVNAIQRQVTALTAEVAGIKDRLAEEQPVKRGPGRPRKVRSPDELTAVG
jgi:hypothetical protein